MASRSYAEFIQSATVLRPTVGRMVPRSPFRMSPFSTAMSGVIAVPRSRICLSVSALGPRRERLVRPALHLRHGVAERAQIPSWAGVCSARDACQPMGRV